MFYEKGEKESHLCLKPEISLEGKTIEIMFEPENFSQQDFK
jgi:hypothetical protein